MTSCLLARLLTNNVNVYQDFEIAAVMNGYWVNFIKTGNPNGDGLVEWPAANASAQVQEVGNEFDHAAVAPAAKVELLQEWFQTLPTF